jgi:transposase
MVQGDIITMRRKELRRSYVIQKVLDKEIKQREAAEVLRLSRRQVKRIIKRVREEGETGIIHRLRGRRSSNAIDEKKKIKVKGICKRRYGDFGPTLASEKLFENEKIQVSKETVRQWMIEEGLWIVRRKRRKHRRWRERKPCYGQMIQMDGSHHDWLEGRGPKLVLMGYIDDAKNKVHARFYEYEGKIPALDSFKRYVKKNGLPQSVYLDKHSTYKSQAKPTIEDELKNTWPESQFERALRELGVDVLHANSPQAKGRIERLFKTFQDRLVKELRLFGAKTQEEANQCLDEYLPKHNKKFMVEAREKGNLHRTVPKGLNLDEILCVKTGHPLRNDFTIVHDKKLYQILDKTAARKIEVQERVDGQMLIVYKGQRLKYKEIDTRPKKIIERINRKVKLRRRYVPPANAPWRRFKINARPQKRKELAFT